MSDSESGSEEEGPSEIDIRFTCKKCPGKEFGGEEREAHREYHRQLKLEKQAGRSARARRRAGSPALSATTNGSLFSVQQRQSRPGPKSKKRASMRTAEQRKAAAVRDHKKKAKNPQTKGDGG